MCYPKPGPRCSGHAKKKLVATKEKMLICEKNDDVEGYLNAADEFNHAQKDYDMTPKGQKELLVKIKETGDSDFKLRNRQELGALNRVKALKSIGKEDKGDLSHEILAPVVKYQPKVKPISISGDNPYNVDYESWPIPQADDLDKISSTVDAIDAGANTSSSIGESIGNVDRGGAYYANAAGYIGLIDKTPDEYGVSRFHLTEHGEKFVALDSRGRAEMMSQMVRETPIMQDYIDNPNKEEAEKMLAEADLGEVSAKRRAGSLRSWYSTLQNSNTLAQSISRESQATKMRVSSALINQQREDQERYERKKTEQEATEPRRGEICSECFMEKSASGVCSNCDE